MATEEGEIEWEEVWIPSFPLGWVWVASQCPRAPALTSRPRRARGQGSTPRAVGRRRRRPSPCGCGRISRPDHPRARADAEAVGLSPLCCHRPGEPHLARGAGPRGARRPRADGQFPPSLRDRPIPWARERRRRPGGEAKTPRLGPGSGTRRNLSSFLCNGPCRGVAFPVRAKKKLIIYSVPLPNKKLCIPNMVIFAF